MRYSYTFAFPFLSISYVKTTTNRVESAEISSELRKSKCTRAQRVC